MVQKDKRDCALFVNYHKEEGISASTKYHDRFLSRKEFAWMSKNQRYLNSGDVLSIINQGTNGLRIPLLVKKSNIEGVDFYFIGDLIYLENSATEKRIPNDKGKQVSVVEMNFVIDEPVEKSLFDYLVNSN